ncbi:bestrophin-2-like [Lutzomyia longipalpis]|uniref:bestrophin-2-like n=1 Tax=Lutzomyia longipalpis TaxID=7200 RepID=UPI002483B9DE|nr:bestrophin-2-like [Lutzomyia longipalpis]
MRRTIVRYVCLCITMVLIRVAPRVKKRFPTLQRLVEAGLLTDSERTIIAKMDERFPRPSKHWMPIVWAASIVTRARKEGLIRDDFAVKTLIDQLNSLRDSASILLKYDTITIPLVYTQVVTLAVYSYCAANILASQWFESSDEGKDQALDVYFPFFSTLQFFFYMGWLKVAEVLINPFGEDDEDFEVNWMIDENLKGCYMIVDEMHHEHPELMKDQYWDEVFPNELPGAEEFHEQHPEASTSKLEIPEAEAHLTSKLPPKIIVDDMSDGNVENGQNQPGQSAENLVDTVTMAFERFFRTEDEQSMQYLKETTQVSTAPSRASLSEGAKVTITVPDGSLEEDNETPEDDEFEKLRLTREKERQERNKLLISNPTQDVATTLDMSAFLEQIIEKNMDKIEPDSD